MISNVVAAEHVSSEDVNVATITHVEREELFAKRLERTLCT